MSILKNQFQKQWFQKHWFQKLRLHDQTHPLSISQIYINERAVRARAGLMLIIPIILLFIRLDHGDHDQWIISPAYTLAQNQTAPITAPIIRRHYSHTFAYSLLFFVMYEMLMAMFVRTSHFSVLSLLGAFLTAGQKPIYQPLRPKIFAWLVGFLLAVLCQISLYFDVMKSIAFYFLAACLLFMWLESVCGICAGCYIYNGLVKIGLIEDKCVPCDSEAQK